MKKSPIEKLINWVIWPSIVALSLSIVALIGGLYLVATPAEELSNPFDVKTVTVAEAPQEPPAIVDGVHVATGLKDSEGLQIVINNCTNCHSAKLISQNRMTADRWRHTIHWMQRTQNLWELGEKEDVIVDYLARNYAPEQKGRRQQLSNITWYELELE